MWPVQTPSAPQASLCLHLLLSLFIRNLLYLQGPNSPWSWSDVPHPGWFLRTWIPLVFWGYSIYSVKVCDKISLKESSHWNIKMSKRILISLSFYRLRNQNFSETTPLTPITQQKTIVHLQNPCFSFSILYFYQLFEIAITLWLWKTEW